MPRFADVLASNPAPPALGDVTLRYEPSMLIGETKKETRPWWPTLTWVAGLSFLLAALAALLKSLDAGFVLPLAVLGAGAFTLAVRLERAAKHQRRFVANFATLTLRLDFTTAISGYPRTLLVAFDDVKAVELLDQADGQRCMTVDFVSRDRVLREVLVAYIPIAQIEDAERVQRVLHGAFGLGEAPADSPAFAEESTFEPASTRR